MSRVRDLNVRRAAELLTSARKVVVLTGAGISVAAGIPDFRSPGGMYDTLRPDLLTATDEQRRMMEADPTSVVSWTIFSQSSLPYLELRRPFILNVAQRRWKPTAAHHFLAALHDVRGSLTRLYSQNIDGLDVQLGIPHERVIHPHGSIGVAECEVCKFAVDDFSTFAREVEEKVRDIYGEGPAGPDESTPVVCASCGRPSVKPATVLYGRPLPEEFFDHLDGDLDEADVVVVVGSSLTVQPANEVAYSATCPVIYLNRESLDAFDAERGDIELLADADDSAIMLAMAMDKSDAAVVAKGGESGMLAVLQAAMENGSMAAKSVETLNRLSAYSIL